MFQGAERGRAFGILGSTIGIATAAGPVIGGLILGIPGPDAWRWVFYVNVPIGVTALLLRPDSCLPPRGRVGTLSTLICWVRYCSAVVCSPY